MRLHEPRSGVSLCVCLYTYECMHIKESASRLPPDKARSSPGETGEYMWISEMCCLVPKSNKIMPILNRS